MGQVAGCGPTKPCDPRVSSLTRPKPPHISSQLKHVVPNRDQGASRRRHKQDQDERQPYPQGHRHHELMYDASHTSSTAARSASSRQSPRVLRGFVAAAPPVAMRQKATNAASSHLRHPARRGPSAVRSPPQWRTAQSSVAASSSRCCRVRAAHLPGYRSRVFPDSFVTPAAYGRSVINTLSRGGGTS
jgi:hypothetical protein